MSNLDTNNNGQQNQASPDTIVTLLQALVHYVGDIVGLLQTSFPRILGSFTMTATVTLAVPAPTITASGNVTITPRNAAAATLQSGPKALYVSAITAGTGFTVATADATTAAGTEIFSYAVTNPV
jgi:hypothetical protein